ncbi:hypothetical protein EMIHUDRAFT_220021 [Emiliania huxleyi CCMP1516]|uniref:Uncharacterized protein n=2 Tax=Emiliania huxleyi TaxID=2903 RepID=A0A0D3I2W0_EMIH1|nr:hypothetical protein EMIHUDRAFT_220021 [Emiliania huxleyi CCMP1516]EOD05595.1 hypothetical protein EMIHUDRAFT_220021 [Emiliania huxleyi CCMP1516]|eukprot:XP_005758024.1 hypothetical protein EMIHUDRAFT_220021 [Emiliania huxleyi CCMP1516]
MPEADAVRELFRSLASSTAGDSPRERQSRAVLLRKMLERGVSPDARDPDDKDQPTLLISACYYADLPLSAAAGEVVAILLQLGARLPAELPPGAADRGWGAQWTAMHKSVSEVAFADGPDLDKPWMEHILGGSAQERVVEFLQQHERQARREAAGAESPAGRPSASSSAVAVILALLLVAEAEGAAAGGESIPGAG